MAYFFYLSPNQQHQSMDPNWYLSILFFIYHQSNARTAVLFLKRYFIDNCLMASPPGKPG